MEKPNYRDFPVTHETPNLKIWSNLEIDQQGKLNINKNERIHQSIIYPFLHENNKLKILSKIDIKQQFITYVITTNNLLTQPKQIPTREYKKLISKIEKEFNGILDILHKQTLNAKQLYNELNAVTGKELNP